MILISISMKYFLKNGGYLVLTKTKNIKSTKKIYFIFFFSSFISFLNCPCLYFCKELIRELNMNFETIFINKFIINIVPSNVYIERYFPVKIGDDQALDIFQVLIYSDITAGLPPFIRSCVSLRRSLDSSMFVSNSFLLCLCSVQMSSRILLIPSEIFCLKLFCFSALSMTITFSN